MRHLLALFLISSTFAFVSCGNPLYKKISAPAANEVVFSLERTPCMGKCPVYKATFDLGEKELRYDGRKFVEHTGEKTFSLSDDEVAHIANLLETNDYLAFEDRYDGPITDVPACITQLSLGGIEEKRVYNRYEGPEKLLELERALDAILLEKLGGVI